MFHKILVPVDGSEPSDAAVSLALRIAGEDKAEVIFVHAIEISKIAALAGPANMDPSVAITAACDAGTALLNEVKERAEKAEVRCACEMPEDECVASVLQLGRHHKADVIVIGSHGRTGISRALLGSIAEGILRRSSIPVLVCHAPRRERDGHGAMKATVHAAEQTII